MPGTEGRRSTTTPQDGGEVPVGVLRQYLIAPRPGLARAAGVQPMSVGMLNAHLDQMGLEVVRRIKRPRRTLATLGVGQGEAADVLVANIEPERAQLIAATAPQLAIGENNALGYGGPVGPLREAPIFGTALPLAGVKRRQIRIRVLGSGDRPLAGANVTLVGDTVPAQGQTDKKGEITLELITIQDRPARTLFVTIPGGYWDQYLTEPRLVDSSTNVVRLRAYTETINGFPTGFTYGWGQRFMGLDRLPPGLSGQGVKIAIIDSGADNAHPLLNHIRIGRDLSENADPANWNNDIVGHGSHCAGVIAARSDDQLRGFAPEAEIHILKVFPGGRYDSLIEALDYCIDHQIDVVNMSLGGGDEVNPAVEETLAAAVLNGVACVVAAGNSGDAVKYPARSPNAFAVAAVGDLQEVQPNTWDSSTFRAQSVAADGVFSPSFTCHGPEVAVCAPGVAIISTVPAGAFEAQTGTSMAAPHVTGLAALVLAHHPVFRSELRERNQARVAGLFSIIRSLCSPYPFGVDRAGAGLPKLDGLESILQPAGQAAEAQPAAAPPVLTPQSVPSGAIGGALGNLLPFQAGPQAPPYGGGLQGTPPTLDPRLLAWLLGQRLTW
jgi:subtilisin